ncbi:MAG: LVIVD repeat-containing protein [Actinomycetota bacterium]
MRKSLALAVSLAVLSGNLLPSQASGATPVAGVPADQVGVNGPIADHLEGLELVGRSAIENQQGWALGNHGGLALVGDCAFVGRWHDYRGVNEIQILDISDPSSPSVIGGVPGSAISGGVAREIRAIDLDGWQMLAVLVFSDSLADRNNNQLLLYSFPDGDCSKPERAGSFNTRTMRGHEFFLWVDPVAYARGERRALAYVTAPIGPPNIIVLDVSDPAVPLLIGTYDAAMPVASPREPAGTYLGTYAHSISLSDDGRTAYVSYWDGGYLTLDASMFADGPGGTLLPQGGRSVAYPYSSEDFGNTHSAVPLPGGETVVVGDEIYLSTDGCPFGWMRFLSIGGDTQPPNQVGEFRLEENTRCTQAAGRSYADVRNSNGDLIDGTFSMHNQTVVGDMVLASWYGAGLRVVDASDPTAPREVAAFVPAPIGADITASRPATSAPIWGADTDPGNDWRVAVWSYPVVRDGLIYVTDIQNGLYILRPQAGSELAEALAGVWFAEGNSNLGALR